MCYQNIKSDNVKFVCDEEFVYLQFENMLPFKDKLIHGFTTRMGGVSKGDFATANFGFSTVDRYEDVLTNYKILAERFNVDINNIVFSRQVHGNNVRMVTGEDTIREFGKIDSVPEYDAMVTNEKDVVLLAFFADCVPVLFFDPKKNVAGIAHSGWKGTVKNVSSKVIDVMQGQYGSNPEDIYAAIGPSIGPCCFEVSENVYLEFKNLFPQDEFYTRVSADKYMVDLWKVIANSLENRGIDRKNILSSNICTKCNNDVFYSYRGQNGSTGRLVGVISLK